MPVLGRGDDGFDGSAVIQDDTREDLIGSISETCQPDYGTGGVREEITNRLFDQTGSRLGESSVTGNGDAGHDGSLGEGGAKPPVEFSYPAGQRARVRAAESSSTVDEALSTRFVEGIRHTRRCPVEDARGFGPPKRWPEQHNGRPALAPDARLGVVRDRRVVAVPLDQ